MKKKRVKLHGLFKDLLNLQICMKLKINTFSRLHFLMSSVTLVEVAMSFISVWAKKPGSTGCSSSVVWLWCVAPSTLCRGWSLNHRCRLLLYRLLINFAVSVEKCGVMIEAAFVSPWINVSSLGCAYYLEGCHWAELWTMECRAHPWGFACFHSIIIK